MTFTESIKSCFSNAFNFGGRAPRSEFWFFYLFQVIVYFVINILLVIVGVTVANVESLLVVYWALYTLVGLVLFFPFLSAAIRRLHDTGRSGWWVLIPLLPLVGIIWYIVLMCKDSDEENDYGLPVY